MPDGVDLIAAERARQVSEEGWTPEHDDLHVPERLADDVEMLHPPLVRAAVCYLTPPLGYGWGGTPAAWPWEPEMWKPGTDRIRQLTKAGALIAAEIDRLGRLDA